MATAAVQQCPGPGQNEDVCARLAREIDEMINRDKRQCGGGGTHGLVHRFREQIQGANGPGTPSWSTHDEAIRNQQNGLRDRLDDFNRNHCGTRVPLPADAWRWATRPAPAPAEWLGPQQRVVVDDPAVSPSTWRRLEQATGLTGAALVLYLIISEGSRLFPPRNLVPVP